MPLYELRSEMPVSAQAAYDWHARPGALERLQPPWQNSRVLERTAPPGGSLLDAGTRVRLRVRVGPLPLHARTEKGAAEPGRYFMDAGRAPPWLRWEHEHRLIPRGDHACLLEDSFRYQLGPPLLGPLFGGPIARRELDRLFRWRHLRTAHDLARHGAYAGRAPLTVAVSGSTGLVGQRLCAFLAAGGHTVRPLVRRAARTPEEIPWNPATGELDAAALADVDAVVHLAGANLAGGYWTAARKRLILDSRVQSTALLARALAENAVAGGRPQAFVCASAMGIYGDTGDSPVDETAPHGTGFLADVCAAWEAAADPARQAGVRTVHVRTGLVLAGEGGLLGRLAPLFRLGLGGPLGNGRQRMSWIAAEDLLTVFLMALHEPEWHGAVNAVAPDAPTNAEFTRALAGVLHRPAPFRAPAWAIRLGLGQLGREALLAGQRLVPGFLRAHGFVWQHPELREALATELGRRLPPTS